jgi:hypothetical protein
VLFLMAFNPTIGHSQTGLDVLTQQYPIGVPPRATAEGDNEQGVFANGNLNMFVPVLSLP